MIIILKLILAVTIIIGLACAGFVAYNIVLGSPMEVDGKSGEPTLHDGDSVRTVPYRGRRQPKRYDVALCYKNYDKKEIIVKRIIGLPGETVQIAGGKIIINGDPLEEQFGPTRFMGMAKNPVTLGEDEYFVLGDNRNTSLDSRQLGPVKRDMLFRRATHVVYGKGGRVFERIR